MCPGFTEQNSRGFVFFHPPGRWTPWRISIHLPFMESQHTEAFRREKARTSLRCCDAKPGFPTEKKMVCASKPWRLCVVRVGHRRAHISRKPRTKSSKNLNVALPHQPTFISRQLKDRFQHVNVQHDQYFVFQFKLYAQRNLGTLFLTWSRWLSTLEKNPAKPKRENVRPSVG